VKDDEARRYTSATHLEWRGALLRGVAQQAGYEVDHVGIHAVRAEHLVPRACLDLRELELHVRAIHLLDLRPRRRAENFDNLDELVDAALSGEERLSEEELRADAARGPHVDPRRVIRRAEDELRGTVVS
jgi:hypothetical protein